MQIKPKLPAATESIRESARRMAEKTKLPYDFLEREARIAVQSVNIDRARNAKEKAFAAGDLDAYRAWMIKEARFTAGLTQQELADLMGTGQPAIARLEDPKYDGQSLSTIMKVAKALGMRFQPPMILQDSNT